MNTNIARPAVATRDTGQVLKQMPSYLTNTKKQAAQIRTAIDALRVCPDQVIELRAIDVPAKYGQPAIVSGLFDDYVKLVECALQLDQRRAGGIYVTINPVNSQLLGRANNRIVERPKSTTSDHDIMRRMWLPFDIDPVRPSGISSTPAQIEAAKKRTGEVVDWLRDEIEQIPDRCAFSGNGYHVHYRINLPNNDESTKRIKDLIERTAERFDDNVVKIDRTVFNASRIMRLYGTTARKGDEVPQLGMLHRRAELLNVEVFKHAR